MKYTILILSLLLNQFLFGQMVQSKSYSVMLKTLLTHDVVEVSVKKAKEERNVIFLDAREKKEYNVSHIQHAIWVGYDDFNMKRVKEIAKDRKIIVYCSVGYRSEKISQKMKSKGYSNVSNMVGGIFEWKNSGFPVVDRKGVKTEKVHAYSEAWGVWLDSGEKVYN